MSLLLSPNSFLTFKIWVISKVLLIRKIIRIDSMEKGELFRLSTTHIKHLRGSE